MAIPKIIHYCWFGGKKLPKSAIIFINSWKKFFPDYEIKRWDESNFDVNAVPYTAEAYKIGKYAFVSDYARFKILYEEGGIYFDTDVEVIKSFDNIISEGAFMGCEHTFDPQKNVKNLGIATGLGFGCEAGDPFIKEILDYYSTLKFNKDYKGKEPNTVVNKVTNLMMRHGLKNTNRIQSVAGFKIYPSQFFCPKSTKDGKIKITPETHSIHHYEQSWQSPFRKYGRKIVLCVGGVRLKEFIKRIIIYNS